MKSLVFSVISFVLLLSSYSCTTTSGFDPLAQSDEGPILWQATKEGKTHHILGTIHLGVDPKKLDPVVWQSFNQSQQFVSELSLIDMDPNKMAMYMIAKPGKGLKQILSNSDWQKLSSQHSNMVPAGVLERFNTYAAQALLYASIFPVNVSIDLTFMSEAKKLGKPSFALETTKFQIGLMKELITVKSLSYIINNPEVLKKETLLLAENYKKGRLSKIWQLITNPTTPELKMKDSEFKRLITMRNQDWSQKLPGIFEKAPTFVAVGAGHLPGKEGILSLLAQKGFKLKRVKVGSNRQ